MKIVCAQSVLSGEDAFKTIGDVVVLPDGEISSADLADASALATRSKTKIDRPLVEGTPLRFVGTATAGFDHIDTKAMEDLGVEWTAAPGCNATSVAEYVFGALLELGDRYGFTLEGKTIAIVGVGQVGSRVARRAEAVGMEVLLNDPPRAAAEADSGFQKLEEVLPRADIVTLHTPLTDEGPFPTRKMVNADFLGKLKKGCIFVNAARGEVVDEEALLEAMDNGTAARTILDVWDNEPYCRRDLLERVDVATPHIAGYSFDGKLRGTGMIYASLCEHFNLRPTWESERLLPPSPVPEYTLHPEEDRGETQLLALIRQIYDVTQDDKALRPAVLPDREEHAKLFNQLRKEYPVRREFSGTLVNLAEPDKNLQKKLAALGFQLG